MSRHLLDYTSPSEEWIEGIPLGSGSIGAMLWGKPGEEKFTFNHDHLFRKKYHKDVKMSYLVETLRDLVLEGKALEGDRLIQQAAKKYPEKINSYQVLGEISLSYPTGEISNYNRSLSLRDGIAEISFDMGKTCVSLETFINRKRNLLAIKFSSDNSFPLRIKISRTEDLECHTSLSYCGGMLNFEGNFDEGVGFCAVIKADGSFDGEYLTLKHDASTVIYAAVSTNLNSENPLNECQQILAECDYEQFKEEQIRENRRLFDRVDFQLDSADNEKKTETLFKDDKADSMMYLQLFHAARYYMIASSEKSLPMNLQGIWNDSIDPMWSCGYTTDMNMQMHYWLAMPGNLAECEQPMFNWICSNKQKMKQHAKNIFGCNGYIIPQYTDLFMETATDFPSFQLFWNGAAAWLADHFYEYYKYTGDEKFLREKAYPFFCGCADFYIEWLVKDETGNYISCPSLSPENMTKDVAWLVNTSTMDISIIEQLMKNLIEIHDCLGENNPKKSKWKDILNHLPPYPKDENGIMKEWIENSEECDPYHRHLSHIYGMFPGKIFTQKTDPNYIACQKAIEKRRSGGFQSTATWSHAWYACCFARMGDGDSALSCINDVIKSGLLTNYFTTHNDWRDQGYGSIINYKLFQIEALLGCGAAICEMFIKNIDDEIEIFGGIPVEWKKCGGSISGIRGYYGTELSARWKDGVITALEIKCEKQEKPVRVKLGMPLEGSTQKEFLLNNSVRFPI